MSIKPFFLQFFTWWNGQTLGTRFFTWRQGLLVGKDEAGNTYYKDRKGIHPTLGFERRWVIYNGQAEASVVPPGWYGWLTHATNESPVDNVYKAHEWELPHKENMTGTSKAYRPDGSILAANKRPPATGDYVPWSP
jgi:NADH:ubiquinone oxidoreductase subunit